MLVNILDHILVYDLRLVLKGRINYTRCRSYDKNEKYNNIVGYFCNRIYNSNVKMYHIIIFTSKVFVFFFFTNNIRCIRLIRIEKIKNII